MKTRLSLLALLLVTVLGRSVDANDPPRHDRIATDLQCRIIDGTPVLVGSVAFKSVKPGLEISLNTEAILRRNGVQVESVILDVVAQPPGGASDCIGACVVPNEACVSYLSGGVQDCGLIAFDIKFAAFPAPGETFKLELVGTPGSAPEMDTTNDSQKKEIPPKTAVGQDRGINSIQLVPSDAGPFFDVVVDLSIPGRGPAEIGVSLILILYKNGEEDSRQLVGLKSAKDEDCTWYYSPFCDCWQEVCGTITVATDTTAAPGDQIRATIAPARDAVADPNPRNNSAATTAPDLPQWNRRASNIEYFPSPTDPTACRVVGHVAASADDLVGEIDLGTAADLYVNGIRVDVGYADFVGTPGFVPNACAANCDLTNDDCVSLTGTPFAECGFLVARIEFSVDVFAGDTVRLVVRERDGLVVVETHTADDVLEQIVPAKAPATEEDDVQNGEQEQEGKGVEDQIELYEFNFQRGDVIPDGLVTITDPIALLDRLFGDGRELACEDTADADDSGDLSLTDAIVILSALFINQSPLPAPGMEECGVDPTEDDLGCSSYDACDA